MGGFSLMHLASMQGLGLSQPLRVIGVTNHVPNSATTRTVLGHSSYTPLDIGSGDVSAVVLTFQNWYINPSSLYVANPNTVPIQKVSLQYNGVSVPVTFAGSRSRTLAIGENDVQSDPISASSFGVGSIPRGARMWVKMTVLLNATSDCVPTSLKLLSGGLQSWYYTPASTTVSDVDVLGAFTYTGTLPSSRQNVMCPFALGYFAAGDPPTRIHYGDSISQSLYDTGTNLYGDGWFQRACAQADNSLPVASMNFGVSGTAASAPVADAKISYWCRYATRGSFMYGANDFGTTGTGQTLASMQARINAIIAMFNASPSAVTKIAGGYVLPRTNTTDSWATEANQTVTSAEWDSGGRTDQYNAWLASLVGTSLSGVLTFPSVRGVSSYKWKVNGSANYVNQDAVHPNSGGHPLMAADARTVFAAMA